MSEHLRLSTSAPFHLEATVRLLQRRPENRVDLWEHDRHWRVLPTAGRFVLAATEDRGRVDRPDLHVAVRGAPGSLESRGEIAATIRWMLGLDVEPAPISLLARSLPGFRHAADALRGMRAPRFPTLFEAFASTIPFQQLSLEAGVAIVGRIVERFGQPLERDGRRWYAFPDSDSIAHARLPALRATGLSRAKAESLRGVARAILSGELSAEKLVPLPSDEGARAMSSLAGIGPWSAGLVLLRGLGKLDVFPPGDAGVARGLARLLGTSGAGRRELDVLLERLGDRRGYLYFASLAVSLFDRGLIRASRRQTSGIEFA